MAEYNANPNTINFVGRTPILEACLQNQKGDCYKAIKLSLQYFNGENSINYNAIDMNNNNSFFTQLIERTREYDLTVEEYETLETLINEEKINLNYRDNQGNSYLHLASRNYSILTILLRHYENIDLVNHKNKTPLLFLLTQYANTCTSKVGEILIQNTKNINHQDNSGNTPLHYAVETAIRYKNHTSHKTFVKLIKLILSKGADQSITNNAGEYAFNYYIPIKTPGENNFVYQMMKPHNDVIILEHYLQEKKYLDAYHFFTRQSSFWQNDIASRTKFQQSDAYQQMLVEALHESLTLINSTNTDRIVSKTKELISMGADIHAAGNNDTFNFIYLLTMADETIIDREIKKEIISCCTEKQLNNFLHALYNEMQLPSLFNSKKESLFSLLQNNDSELFEYILKTLHANKDTILELYERDIQDEQDTCEVLWINKALIQNMINEVEILSIDYGI